MIFPLFLAAALQAASPAGSEVQGPVQGPVETGQAGDSVNDSRAVPADPADVGDSRLANQERLIRKSLATWQGGAAKHDGKVGCVTKQTTGDKQIDAIRCGAVVECFTPIAPKLDALEANDTLTDDERQTRMKALAESTAPCLQAYTDKAVAQLAKTRAGE